MAEYISKQNVLDYLNGYLHSLGEGGADDLLFDRGQRRALINAIQDISAVKVADVQPICHGRWINDGDCMITSCCNTAYDIGKFERKGELIYLPCKCPNCGARMDGDTE